MRATLTRELTWAHEQLRALLPDPNAAAMAADPVLLARAAGLDPDPWQEKALRSTALRLAFNVTRQGGKSTIAATLADHTAVYRPGSLVLLLSPGLRQSKELFRKVVQVYRATGRPVSPETENTLELGLSNGSRVVSLPGTEKTVRGFSAVDLLIVDEASRVDDALYAAIRPMLAVSNGRLITMSTPWGARGWWWKEWVDGGTTWERYEIPATACPRISAEFLAEERRYGELFYASEYECRFVDTEDMAFRSEDVEAALDSSVRPLWGAA